jgi:hypothetical protein
MKLKFIVPAVLVVLVLAVVVLDQQKRSAEAQLQQVTTGQSGSQGSNASQAAAQQAQADKVIAEVEKLMTLDTPPQPTVAQIVDVTKLQAQNPTFYAKAKNGDYLIVTPTRAVLFDEQQNLILNVAQVQITPTSAASSASVASAASSKK